MGAPEVHCRGLGNRRVIGYSSYGLRPATPSVSESRRDGCQTWARGGDPAPGDCPVDRATRIPPPTGPRDPSDE